MEKLIEFMLRTLAECGECCTPCLIDFLGNEHSELPGNMARLEAAHVLRGISPDGEEEFTAALAEFLTNVIHMAAFTAVLMDRPGVRWIDESVEIAIPVVIVLN